MKSIFVILSLMFLTSLNAAEPTQTTPPEWLKYTVPGEGHKELEKMVGNWKYTSKWWMSAKAKPEASVGTSKNTWVLDGRFVQQEVKGTAMGQPFSGIGFTGYDSFKKTYQSVWMDNMSTAMMTTAGTQDAKTKVITEKGVMSSPMENLTEKAFRNETKFKNKNSFIYSMFAKEVATGKEFKTLEMVYTREN